MAKLHQQAAGTENHQGFLHRFCQNNGFPTHLDSGFYPVYRPVGQSVVRHMMVNVSAARRELVHVRSSETSTIINSKHESCSQGVYLGFFLIQPHMHIISPISIIRIH